MLLIVTNSTDATADFAESQFAAQQLPYRRIDTDEYPHRVRLTVSPDGAVLETDRQRLDLSEVRAVWWRRPIPPQIHGRDHAVALWAAEEARLALDGALRSVSAHWVNHPDANRVAQDKIAQLRRAAQLGFAVPDWVLTNSTGVASEFLAGHADGVVAKPLGAGRLDDRRTFWTSKIDGADARLLGAEPYLLQRFVSRRADVRVTVVGEEVFAVSIDASVHPEADVDWRRAGRRAHHEVLDLDEATRRFCLVLAESFGLSFAALDFAFDGEQLWFLEVNPNGQWAWLEVATGVPIAAALARLFAGHA